MNTVHTRGRCSSSRHAKPARRRYRPWLIPCAIGVIALSAPGAAAQCQPAWTGNLALGVDRQTHAVAYDAVRQQVVLFGGAERDSSSPIGSPDTWAWDGTAWKRVISSGPSPRNYATMAYDSIRQRVVLFGGRNQTSPVVRYGDTWEWDGRGWTQVATTGPAPRYLHAMAFDQANARTILFGGSGPGVGTETWAWDGAAWTQLATAGPPLRDSHAMAYDEANARVILFGGFGDVNPLGDTWAWDGAAWTQVAFAGPSARYQARMIYDTDLQRIVLFGGVGEGFPLGDTWAWDGLSWNQVAEAGAGPSGRIDFAMAYDQARHQTVVVGGDDASTIQGDTWTLDVDTWSLAARSPRPPAPPVVSGAFDSLRGRLVVYGFPSGFQSLLGEWDGEHWTMIEIDGPPGVSADAAMAFDQARGVCVLYGGDSGDARTWTWNGSVWTQAADAGAGPGSRRLHAMAYDPLRQRTVMMGGRIDATDKGDTWEWDGAAWTQVATTGPGVRSNHAMAYNPVSQRVMLFGGQASDTWEWNGASWTQVAPAASGPIYRFGAALTYDPASNRMIIFGGNTGGQDSGRTYAWTGSSWVEINVPQRPAARRDAVLVTDSMHGYAVAFGGGINHNDTIAFYQPQVPVVTDDPDSITTAAGQAASFTVAVPGPFLSYAWRKDGVPIANQGNISGALSATLVINPVTEADAGSYECLIANSCATATSAAATLTIAASCPADLNGDGLIDFGDYLEFLNLFDAQDPRVDYNMDGLVDFSDYLEFLNHFDAGC